MAASELYYSHSGKFKIHAPFVLFLGVGICSILLGAVYGVGMFYCPSVYISLFLPFGVGLAVGGMVYLVAKWTHIRNTTMLITAGLLLGLLLEYTAFIAWIYALSEWELIIYMPQDLKGLLSFLAIDGVWEVFGVVFKGPMLYFAWAVELTIILACAAILPWKFIQPKAYCEQCNRWITDHKSVLPFEMINDTAGFKAQLEQGEFAILGSLAGVPQSAPEYTSYDLSHCSSCNDLHLLSIETIKTTIDGEGKAQTNKTDVIRNLLIDAESMALIEELDPGVIPEPDEAPDEDVAAQDTPADGSIDEDDPSV